MGDFTQWWHTVGSGIAPRTTDEERSSHAERVARAAWDSQQTTIDGLQKQLASANRETERLGRLMPELARLRILEKPV